MSQVCFKEILKRFKGLFERRSKGISQKVSKVFQKSFDEVLFCNFVVAWISSQLPEQKEGLIGESQKVLRVFIKCL